VIDDDAAGVALVVQHLHALADHAVQLGAM
jgi:hypothetical protein